MAFFALLRLHTLSDWLKKWDHHLVSVPVPPGAKDWGAIPIPLPISRLWKCRTSQQGPHEPVDKGDDDGDASSDDDEVAELEPAAELEDMGFIEDLDRVMDDIDVSRLAAVNQVNIA